LGKLSPVVSENIVLNSLLRLDDERCQVMVKNRYDPTSNKKENCKGTFFKENKIMKMGLKKINIPYIKTQNIVLASSSGFLLFSVDFQHYI
jgi:hypothetical protein